MKRLIFGVILLAFYFLAILGSIIRLATEGPPPPLTMGETIAASAQAAAITLFIIAVPGGLLAYFGYKASIGRDHLVSREASLMLAETGKIDVTALSQKLGIPDAEICRALAKAQKRGRVPQDAAISTESQAPEKPA